MTNKYEVLLKEAKFYKHPKEDCVLRTVPKGKGQWITYVKFSQESEFEVKQPSDLIISSLWKSEPQWITKQEYEAY